MKPFKLTRLSYIEEAGENFNPDQEYHFVTVDEFISFLKSLPSNTIVHFNSKGYHGCCERKGQVEEIRDRESGYYIVVNDGQFFLDNNWIQNRLKIIYKPSEGLLDLEIINTKNL